MTSTKTLRTTSAAEACETACTTGRLLETVAIGDVHGRADLLEALLEEVTSAPERRRVVFLGDIVDRGPDSRLALKLVAQELEASSQSFLLLGNHEELMLKFLDERHKGGPFHIWMQNGGVRSTSIRISTRTALPRFCLTLMRCRSCGKARTCCCPMSSPSCTREFAQRFHSISRLVSM